MNAAHLAPLYPTPRMLWRIRLLSENLPLRGEESSPSESSESEHLSSSCHNKVELSHSIPSNMRTYVRTIHTAGSGDVPSREATVLEKRKDNISYATPRPLAQLSQEKVSITIQLKPLSELYGSKRMKILMCARCVQISSLSIFHRGSLPILSRLFTGILATLFLRPLCVQRFNFTLSSDPADQSWT